MTEEHQVTPRLTVHARERCAEMGLTTKTAKRIYQHRSVTYPGNRGSGCIFVVSNDYPGYAVVVNEEQEDRPVIVTVVFQTYGEYIRKGTTYEAVEE